MSTMPYSSRMNMSGNYDAESPEASFSYRDSDSFNSARKVKNSFGTPKQSFGDPKASFGSNASFEYWNVDGDTNDTTSDNILAGLDPENWGVSGDDEFDKLNNDRIFRELYPRDEFKNSPECYICKTKFGGLKFKKRRHCKFCGEAICDEHGKKKRPDPQNPSQAYRICDTCEMKYINRIILKEFHERVKRRDKEIQQYEKLIKEQQIKMNDVQKEHGNLTVKKSKLDKAYTDEVNYLTAEVAKIKEETKRAEKESQNLVKESQEYHKKVEAIEEEYNRHKEEYEKLKKEATTLNHQIDAINMDIMQINRQVKHIDELIAKSKMGKTQDLNGTTFFAGSVLNNESIMEPGDSILQQSHLENDTPGNGHYRPMKGAKGKNRKNEDLSKEKGGVCNLSCNTF